MISRAGVAAGSIGAGRVAPVNLTPRRLDPVPEKGGKIVDLEHTMMQ